MCHLVIVCYKSKNKSKTKLYVHFRLAKEKVMYEKESEKEKAKLERMQAAGDDSYMIRKQVSSWHIYWYGFIFRVCYCYSYPLF